MLKFPFSILLGYAAQALARALSCALNFYMLSISHVQVKLLVSKDIIVLVPMI